MHAHSTAARTFIDNTISASHKAGAPAEHLEQARQAAYTLIKGLQGLCAAAGAVTVADEPEDPMMDFDGSDEEFRQIRRRNRQVGKKTLALQTLANRERNLNSHKSWRSPARTTHNAVRVTHTVGQIAPGRVLDALRERFLQRGAEPCALLTLRIQRSAMKRAITDDLQAWLGKLAGEANEAAAKEVAFSLSRKN